MEIINDSREGSGSEAAVLAWLNAGQYRSDPCAPENRPLLVLAEQQGWLRKDRGLSALGRAALRGYQVAQCEVTRQRQAKERLCLEKKRYQQLFEHAPACLVELDLSRLRPQLDKTPVHDTGELKAFLGKHPEWRTQAVEKLRVRDANVAACALFEVDHKSSLQGSLTDWCGGSNEAVLLLVLKLLLGHQGVLEHEAVCRSRQGRRLEVLISVISGPTMSLQLSFVDITKSKKRERQLEHRAHHDELTGLPNRALLRDRLDTGLARAQRNKRCLALLFIDLDGFKLINDSLGHHVGDELLKAVAKRLKRCARRSDTVARYGGDEFAYIMEAVRSKDDAMGVARKILQMMAPPYCVDGFDVSVTPSIGIAMFDASHPAITPQALIRHADAAMYNAKDSGNCFEFFAAVAS
ncbi:MAG TPA: GGDEF domain-containing protein [Acidiferrobacteraceae bacterium]|nr:GGDEF domain-containing protein [Acidiferrobacteraceae bacterium]